MKTDGSHINHESKSDYNKVFNTIEGSGVKMMGEHDVEGGEYELRDEGGTQVGWVSFDKRDTFLAAKWYGEVVVSGRAHSRREALASFLREVEKTHG